MLFFGIRSAGVQASRSGQLLHGLGLLAAQVLEDLGLGFDGRFVDGDLFGEVPAFFIVAVIDAAVAASTSALVKPMSVPQ